MCGFSVWFGLFCSADEELIVPQKVETGDTVKMKQVMDEAVIKAVSECNVLQMCSVKYIVRAHGEK